MSDNISYSIIDTAPANHIYTGGLLCNLLNPVSDRLPDYICGEQTWDGATHTLNWYHWNGTKWVRTHLSTESGIAVGMDSADLTGNGTTDIVTADWPLGPQAGSDGHVYWFEQPDKPLEEPWPRHVLATGWGKAHDLHIGDIRGAGCADVLVRLKDERISWYSMPENPRDPWCESQVAEVQAGDGTALYDVTGDGLLDIVTGTGYYERRDKDGRDWNFHPFQATQELEVDVETRVVVGDLLGDGSVCVVLSESEVLPHARLLLLHSRDGGRTWDCHTLIDRERNLGALHSLQLLDANGDGRLDIFAAEMELYMEDLEIERRPTWRLFRNDGQLRFTERTVLDANLGAHQGRAGRITGGDDVEFIAKNWKANSANACDGTNHVVHVVHRLGSR
mgnify:FL=1